MTTARKAPTATEHGVILLAGIEEFLIRGELERLIHENVTEDARAFDFNEFRASEVNASEFWNAVITMPLLASRRIVILHLQGEPKDELLKTLNLYAANPSSTTLLIIVQVFEERGTPVRLEGKVQVLTFPAISSVAKRAQWAQEYARQAGKELPFEAAEYVVSISTPRLADLAAKLEHAMLYVGDQNEITGQVLMQVSGVTSEYLPWELEDAILERHPKKIFERARSMEAGGEELLRLLAYQRGALMQLWRVGSLARKLGVRKLDKSGRDLLTRESQGILRNKAFKSGDLCQAYWAIGENKIRRSVVDLLDLEVGIKTGRASWRAYYDWLWRLISPSPSHGTSNIT